MWPKLVWLVVQELVSEAVLAIVAAYLKRRYRRRGRKGAPVDE